MAIDERFLSVGGLLEIWEAGKTDYTYLQKEYQFYSQQELIDDIINRITNTINYLQSQEEVLLSNFKGIGGSGHPKDEKELQQVFANFYKNSGLENFSGDSLKKIIEGYEFGGKASREDIDKVINLMMEEALSLAKVRAYEYMKAEGTDIFPQDLYEKWAEKEIHTLLQTAMNKIDYGSRRYFGAGVALTTATIIKFENKKASFNFSEFTDPIKDRFVELTRTLNKNFKFDTKRIRDRYAKRYNQLFDENYGLNYIDEYDNNDFLFLQDFKPTQVSENKMSVYAEFELGELWRGYTQGLRTSKAREEVSEKKRKEVSTKIKNKILSLINGDVAPGASRIIDIMLAKEPNMFYIGESNTELIGLLGEISAYIAIYHLLDNKYNEQIIQWVATTKANKKKLSIDIVIEDIAGINIKHTSLNELEMEDIGHKITFSKAEPEYVLNKLMGDEQSKHFGDVLTSTSFNTGYRYNIGRRMYQHTDNPGKSYTAAYNYKQVEKMMEELKNDIELFLKLFTPEFLYMANESEGKHQLLVLDEKTQHMVPGAGNLLYIVATVPFLASTRLITIKKELEEFRSGLSQMTLSSSFQFDLNTKVSKQSGDIVDYLNKYGRRNTSNLKKVKTTLTSAYLF